MYTHKQEAQQVLTPPVVEPERYRLHNTEAGVKVPFSQALISGVISGVAMMAICWVLDVLDPWKPGIVIMALVTPLVWFLSRRNWVGLVNRVEEWTGLDLPGNDAPEDKVTLIDLTSKVGATRRTQKLAIPATEEQLRRLAVGILGGVTFAERNWTGRGRPFSIDQFRELRDYLEKAELLTKSNDKSHNQGFTLTAKGRAMLAHYLPHPGEEED
jgi:hypothetical protein